MEDKPIRKNLRLKEYNYSDAGYYFVTLCLKDRKCLFGDFVGRDVPGAPQMRYSEYGVIANDRINTISEYVDKYVIMPNHIHIILQINNSGSGAPGTSRPTNRLSSIVGYYKKLVNKQIGFNVWQASYYDHIIRNEQDYLRICEYIDTNPLKWETDKYYFQS